GRQSMRQCPTCGSEEFRAVRKLTIWQTITLEFTDDAGNWDIEEDELGDTDETGPFEELVCANCSTSFDVALLNGPMPDTKTPAQAMDELRGLVGHYFDGVDAEEYVRKLRGEDDDGPTE